MAPKWKGTHHVIKYNDLQYYLEQMADWVIFDAYLPRNMVINLEQFKKDSHYCIKYQVRQSTDHSYNDFTMVNAPEDALEHRLAAEEVIHKIPAAVQGKWSDLGKGDNIHFCSTKFIIYHLRGVSILFQWSQITAKR